MMRIGRYPTPTRPNRCSQLARYKRRQRLGLAPVVERGDRLAPGLLHQLMIAQQIADAQRRHARLPRAEEIAGTAQREVALGDDEAVGRVGQRLEPLARLLGERRTDTGARSTTDARPRPTRPRSWCSCDRPNRSACSTTMTMAFGHVDADLHDGRRDQDVELAARERAHHAVLVVLLHAAVQQGDAIGGKHVLRQVVGHLGRGPQIDLVRLLDERIDDVRLPPGVELLADEVVDLVAPRLGLGDRLDRLTSGRHLAHD